jgi:CheY-like chemotaxis protein
MASAKILVVEDESIVALDIRNRLKRLGYVVVGVADTGEDAVYLAHLHLPDVVLMDIRLKGDMDGIAAAMHILRQQESAVIYLTASMDEPTVQRAQTYAPAPFLAKPFDISELHDMIETLINRRAG